MFLKNKIQHKNYSPQNFFFQLSYNYLNLTDIKTQHEQKNDYLTKKFSKFARNVYNWQRADVSQLKVKKTIRKNKIGPLTMKTSKKNVKSIDIIKTQKKSTASLYTCVVAGFN